MNTLTLALAVAVFGGIASIVRLGLARWTGWLPWGILFANTAASFLAGVEIVGANVASPLIIAGLCGGLSTFSTFTAQTVDFYRAGLPLRGTVNLLANLVLPFTAALAPLAFA
jgi:CrcB protein